MKLNLATLAVLLSAAVLFALQLRRAELTPPRIAGLCVAAVGAVLLVTARLQLGRAFSVRAKATTLVTTGLYSRIRNPIYVSAALVILGIIIVSGQPWYLLVFAVMIPLQIYRSKKEAQVLEEKFGDAYREYRRKTWF